MAFLIEAGTLHSRMDGRWRAYELGVGGFLSAHVHTHYIPVNTISWSLYMLNLRYLTMLMLLSTLLHLGSWNVFLGQMTLILLGNDPLSSSFYTYNPFISSGPRPTRLTYRSAGLAALYREGLDSDKVSIKLASARNLKCQARESLKL